MAEEEKYLFRKATFDEVQAVFHLVLDCIRWMEAVGIRQWNVTDYVF